MYITVTMQINEIDYSIQADENLPIFKALEALQQGMKISGLKATPTFYKSLRKHRLISAHFTFKQAEIFSGDTLAAINL